MTKLEMIRNYDCKHCADYRKTCFLEGRCPYKDIFAEIVIKDEYDDEDEDY